MWSNCSTSLQQISCTYDDVVVVAMQYSAWSSLNNYDLTQERYRVSTESLGFLSTNIYPGMLSPDVSIFLVVAVYVLAYSVCMCDLAFSSLTQLVRRVCTVWAVQNRALVFNVGDLTRVLTIFLIICCCSETQSGLTFW